jgi:hypothetical protein
MIIRSFTAHHEPQLPINCTMIQITAAATATTITTTIIIPSLQMIM